MHSFLRLAALPLLAAPALAQLPAPTLISRTAPRAAWTAVTSAGTSSTTIHQRADNCGAASNDKLYVFGGSKGNNTSTTLNDLWEFDAAAGTFTQLIANSAVPAPATQPTHRGRACVAWNFTTNKLVLFGGNTRQGGAGALPAPGTLLNDTWEWDPNTNTWTDVTPVSGNPSPRERAAMTWDPVTGGMLMFGGDLDPAADTPASPLSDTWLFIGGVWAQMSPANVPPARGNHSMVTRTDFNDVVMCLGGNYSAAPNNIAHLDVWQWNGADWSMLSDGTLSWPASALGNQAIYDPIRHRIVVQGGQGLTTANSTLYGPSYGGSPSNYCSEFDSFTVSWSIYANPTTGATPFNNNDPAIGRISRYFGGFVPATGKVYKVCGQNVAGASSNPFYNVYEYQANPVASVTPYGVGCTGPGGPLSLTADAPWTERSFTATATGLGPLSFGFAIVSLGQLNPGVPLVALPLPGPGAGCELGVASLDITAGLIPVAGTAVFTLSMPSAQVDPTLPGLLFYTQIAELDFSAGWVGTYATNSVACVIGSL
jgi:hypothetical protein